MLPSQPTCATKNVQPCVPLHGGGDAAYGLETQAMRLDAGEWQLCHAFASDIYLEGSESGLPIGGTADDALLLGGAAPSPPPPSVVERCADASHHVISDSLFRMQYGVTLLGVRRRC